MALFKLRLPGQKVVSQRPARAGQADSVQAMRQRAKHRLIGAVVLVLIGVVGFPMLFDTQPRPVAVDIPIDIPDKNKVRPLTVPGEGPSGRIVQGGIDVPSLPVASAAKPAQPAPSAVSASASLAEREQLFSQKQESKQAPALTRPDSSATKKEAKPAPDTAPAVEARPTARKDDGARARALLEGAPPDRPAAKTSDADNAAASRFVVQIGAFSDDDKARQTRLKVERAGLKTYTHVIDTADGKRTRVRVGPFDRRADAEKAAAKVKSLSLPAAILTL